MKKILLLAILLSAPMLKLFAQSEKSLELYYIEHSRTTPIYKLCETLKEVFESSKSDANREVYFYLANADSPVLFRCLEENRSQMERMTAEIMSKSFHPVFPEYDLRFLTDFFNEHDIITDRGDKLYDFVNVFFYINPSFWVNGYQESLISRLAFIIDYSTLPKDYIHFDIYHPSTDDLVYETKKMFGEKALIPDFEYILTYGD